MRRGLRRSRIRCSALRQVRDELCGLLGLQRRRLRLGLRSVDQLRGFVRRHPKFAVELRQMRQCLLATRQRDGTVHRCQLHRSMRAAIHSLREQLRRSDERRHELWDVRRGLPRDRQRRADLLEQRLWDRVRRGFFTLRRRLRADCNRQSQLRRLRHRVPRKQDLQRGRVQAKEWLLGLRKAEMAGRAPALEMRSLPGV